MDIPSLPIAVVMEWVRLDNPWATGRWEAIGVVEDGAPSGTPARTILEDAQQRRVLHPGLSLELHRDEAENYWLNVSTAAPKVFVLWRLDGEDAKPAFATVSYGEAARWMDANEQVDAVPMPPEIFRWVGEFVENNYRPETVRRKGGRYATSKLGQDGKHRPS